MNQLNTIGNQKRVSRFDPDLARKVAEEYEQEQRRKKIEDKLRGKKQEPEKEITPSTIQPQQGLVETLLCDDIGKEILRLHNEKFKGKDKIEDLAKYEDNQPISYSNIPRALSYNLILLQNYGSGLLSPEEVIINWNEIPDKESTYSDTNSISLYPNPGVNEDKRQEVLRLIGKSSIKIPYVVSNPGVEPADNNQGFIFTGSDFLSYQEAPFLQKDGNLSYDGSKLIQTKEGIQVYTPNKQDGLRGLFRYRAIRLNARYDGLLGSFESGRVNFARRARKK